VSESLPSDEEYDGEGPVSGSHIPVMAAEVSEYLQPRPDGVYIDGTLGLGGHAEKILAAMGSGWFIGVDQDEGALKAAAERLGRFSVRKNFIHDNFRNLGAIAQSLGVEAVDGILLDIGVSSVQLDNAQRGFNFREDGPLDMRMDPSAAVSAYDLVNGLSEREIEEVLRLYGEERFSRRIARVIVDRRMAAPLETTQALKDAVMAAMPGGRPYQKIHPATRTFQAFRIAVNRELDALEAVLPNAIALLKPCGRIVVISFHSLEDRIVKTKFRQAETAGLMNILTKKPLRPSEQEIGENSRARSARLRAGEKRQ
jgi:16S rRNA (cytosine1402-N4)-methyltransferase